MTGTLLFAFVVVDAEEAAADNNFRGRVVVDIVIRLGVELPSGFAVVVMTEAAFANREPVRLLKAGTVVNWIAGVVEGICVMVVAMGEKEYPNISMYNIKINQVV